MTIILSYGTSVFPEYVSVRICVMGPLGRLLVVIWSHGLVQ